MRTDPHPPRSRVCMPIVLLLALLAAALPVAGARAAAGPALRVDAGADRRPIAPEIYGMSFADPALAAEIGLPVNRWGGNHTDRYNWREDTWNTGRDWYFENIPGCWSACADDPPADPSQGYRRIVDGDRAMGAQTLLTLPMVGWVAKRPTYRHPLLCSYPQAAYPGQDDYDLDWTAPGDPGACGNGRRGGSWLTGNDPAIANEPSTPQLSADWIAAIRRQYGAGAVGLYGLGNEPGLWDDTHVDVHPRPATYDEILAKSAALAIAAKTADPDGRTLGFSEWGWANWFCSSADLVVDVWRRCFASSPDRAAHGGEPLVTWFLDRMRERSQQCGVRLLDYLDVHYYQEGGSSAEVTRSLWDPSYRDPSWIDAEIRAIPRMREWVEGHYPGTRISLSEYDLSIGDPVTDTLIQADALGIFARERLDLAARWGAPEAGDPQANGFRLYRDYDGAGGRFGATWVRSESDDQSRVSVYGALRDGDGALTVALVNKSGQSQTVPLALSGLAAGAGANAQTWRWTGGAAAFAPGPAVARGGDGSLTLTLPARSLTMAVVPGAVAAGSLPDAPADPALGSGATPLAGCGGDPGREPGEEPGRRPGEGGGDRGGQGGDRGGDGGPGGGDRDGGGQPGDRGGGTGGQGGRGGGTGEGGGRAGGPGTLADRAGLPSAARCVRGRRLALRLRSPLRGRRLLRATVRVSGRRARTVRGGALRRTVTLTGLPRRGRYTVTVRMKLSGRHNEVIVQRRFSACS